MADPWEDLQAEDLLLQQVLLVRRGFFFQLEGALFSVGIRNMLGLWHWTRWPHKAASCLSVDSESQVGYSWPARRGGKPDFEVPAGKYSPLDYSVGVAA